MTEKNRKFSIGKISIGAGLVAMLICGAPVAHQLWFTDNSAQEHAEQVLADLKPATQSDTKLVTTPTLNGEVRKSMKIAAPETTKTGMKKGTPSVSDAKPGQAFGTVENPLFGAQPLVMGDIAAVKSQAILNTGVVVSGTRYAPGQVGNFSITGHRTSHGAVFKNAVNLKLDDSITVKTADAVFEYRVIKEAFAVAPDDRTILDSNPLSDEKNTTQKLMTLVTCGDLFDNTRQIIVLELAE